MSSKQDEDVATALVGLAVVGAVLFGVYWLVIQVIPETKKLTQLDGKPWWLVPLAVLASAVLIVGCVAITHLPRRRPRQRVISVPGFINRPSLKSTVLLIVPVATFCTLPGSFDAVAGLVVRSYDYASGNIAADEQSVVPTTDEEVPQLAASVEESVNKLPTTDEDQPYCLLGNYDPKAAEQEYQQALEDLRGEYSSPTEREFVLKHAELALKHRRPKDALDAYITLTTLYPEDRAFAYRSRAEILYHDLRNPQAALTEVERSLALVSDPEVRRLRGAIHYSLSNFKQSATDFTETSARSDAALVYYKMGDQRAAFRMIWQQNELPQANPHSVLFVVWHFAVTNRDNHLALARIADDTNPELATAKQVHNLISTAKPYIQALGFPPVTDDDRISYKLECFGHNMEPWLPFTVWAAALAAENQYDAAEKFARDALDFADERQAEETKKHIAAYARQTPWRTNDYAKVLYDLGTNRKYPENCSPLLTSNP